MGPGDVRIGGSGRQGGSVGPGDRENWWVRETGSYI